MWGELISESGASCLRVSLMWGKLSLGELSCIETFCPKSVSPEVLDKQVWAKSVDPDHSTREQGLHYFPLHVHLLDTLV